MADGGPPALQPPLRHHVQVPAPPMQPPVPPTQPAVPPVQLAAPAVQQALCYN